MRTGVRGMGIGLVMLALSACLTPPERPLPQPLGDRLGSLQYVVDLPDAPQTVPDVLIGDEIGDFADTLDAGYQAPQLGAAVRDVDPSSVLVLLYFDACDRDEPALYSQGDRVQVGYGVRHDRACARPVDTLTVFEVPRGDLPDPVHFALCGDETITIDGFEKTGRIDRPMC